MRDHSVINIPACSKVTKSDIERQLADIAELYLQTTFDLPLVAETEKKAVQQEVEKSTSCLLRVQRKLFSLLVENTKYFIDDATEGEVWNLEFNKQKIYEKCLE